jgi:hypothetical protein
VAGASSPVSGVSAHRQQTGSESAAYVNIGHVMALVKKLAEVFLNTSSRLGSWNRHSPCGNTRQVPPEKALRNIAIDLAGASRPSVRFVTSKAPNLLGRNRKEHPAKSAGSSCRRQHLDTNTQCRFRRFKPRKIVSLKPTARTAIVANPPDSDSPNRGKLHSAKCYESQDPACPHQRQR